MRLFHNLYRILRTQRSKMGRRNGENYGTSLRVANISHEVRQRLLPLSVWAAAPLFRPNPLDLLLRSLAAVSWRTVCPALFPSWHIWNIKWKIFVL